MYCWGHVWDCTQQIMHLMPGNALWEVCYAHPIVIEDNVWIGAGVHIMGGVTIGRNSVIGAGSVVTKDVPENVIAAGVPCKVIREITDDFSSYQFCVLSTNGMHSSHFKNRQSSILYLRDEIKTE